jgi:pSer/pThr/pTyr-binding forkhead associated (FHA) protein
MRLARAIIVHGDKEFFIGRIGQESSTELMVDLESFGGFMMGVSRRHAVIRPANDGYEITDLSSRNGTWLDGQRLFPNRAYPMASGEKLRIGRERLLVRYRSA